MKCLNQPDLAIHFAPPGTLARQVVKRSNARKTSKYPSWKMGGMLQCESENERNCMLLLDLCPWVKSYRPQPCIIEYRLNGHMFKHFPDLLANMHSGHELIEVKPRAFANHPDIARRTAFLTEVLPAHGYRYRLMLAEDLALSPRLENAELIKRLGKGEVPALQRERIRILFQQHPSIPWGALQQDRHNPYLVMHVCRMVLEGQLSIDLNQPLTDNPPVRWVINPSQSGGASWESLISKKAQ
jgi:hypothetical protein